MGSGWVASTAVIAAMTAGAAAPDDGGDDSAAPQNVEIGGPVDPGDDG